MFFSIDEYNYFINDLYGEGIEFKNITIKEMIEKIKINYTKLEWTYGYNESNLYDIAYEVFLKSKKLYKDCLNNGIKYFDISVDDIAYMKKYFNM